MSYKLDDTGFKSQHRKEIFLFSKILRLALQVCPNVLVNKYGVFFPGGKVGEA
jgi:hypothetical protein